MIVLKGRIPHTKHAQKKLVENEVQQKKAKYASIKQGKAKGWTKLSDNFPGGRGGVVCYTAVFNVVTQRSSPLTAAENRTTFLSRD